MGNTLTYILPIKSQRPVSSRLMTYLDRLRWNSLITEVIVVDGSDAEVFSDFAMRCGPFVRHIPVDEDLRGLANGKVAGVLTGIRHASNERVILADDDVRYDAAALEKIDRALDEADVVRPQNYFAPLPWHACLDTARTLINRATGGDWPGTLGVRREMLVRTGGYDGNVLFENLELVRTIRAAGGREARPLDLFVRRRPPAAAHFWKQRVRQAYDEFARPHRMLVWLSLLPLTGALIALYGVRVLPVMAWLAIALAEVGRQIGHGTAVFPLRTSLIAPFWVLERAITAWLAVGMRIVRGGVWYSGKRLRRAATPSRELAARIASLTAATGREAERSR